jgi:DUF971 family protein
MARDPRTTPTGIKAPHGSRVFEVRWADGVTQRYPHKILRGFCPCAGCQGHGGSIRFVDGVDLELRKVGQVGNYALSLEWGDGHDAGIYSFTFLRRLGELLEEHGADGLEKLGELPRA